MIGDNLASHISYKVISLCQENEIAFCLLPPNTTHLTQPLDVCVFRPMKLMWRKVLDEWKKRNKGYLQKQCFPSLLNQTLRELASTIEKNIKSGFEATGIIPIDRQKVLKKIPRKAPETPENEWKSSLIEILDSTRNATKPTIKKRSKISVTAGKSIGVDDFNTVDSQSRNITLEENEPQEEHVEDEAFMEHIGDEYLEEHVENAQDENETLQENYELDQDENEISIFPEDFVEVCFKNEKVKKYYIGKITSVVNKTKFIATFLRPNRKLRNTFIFPPVEDSSEIDLSQIVKKLPAPVCLRRGGFQFPNNCAIISYNTN